MNDKAMKSFGLRLKGEAVRHKKVSLCFLPWVQREAKVPAKHTSHCSDQSANARSTQATRITPRSHSWSRDVGPAHSPSRSEPLTQGRQSSLLPAGPQCHVRSQVGNQPGAAPDSSVWAIPAASVADQLQHLLRIYYLLPGFASSFPSRHLGSIYLLPVREGNRTDPWGDGERQD